MGKKKKKKKKKLHLSFKEIYSKAFPKKKYPSTLFKFPPFPPLGGSTYKEILKDLLSKTHFFEISVKKPTKMGVPGRKSPWGSPIYPNKPPDDLHRAFLV